MGAYRRATKALKQRIAVVDISAAEAAPPVTARTLKRLRSDPLVEDSITRDREALWHQAATQRKRFISFMTVQGYNPRNLSNARNNSRWGRPSWEAKLFESHRAWVFSADLFIEAINTPWAEESPWSPTANHAVQYALAQREPHDIIMLFDGRSRACRRALEKALDDYTAGSLPVLQRCTSITINRRAKHVAVFLFRRRALKISSSFRSFLDRR